VMPGASNPEQVTQNASVAALPPLREDQLTGVRAVYDSLLREHVHSRW
jgi:aryl-alcohol dehydrogenase-like predicted oxidoreductase